MVREAIDNLQTRIFYDALKWAASTEKDRDTEGLNHRSSGDQI